MQGFYKSGFNTSSAFQQSNQLFQGNSTYLGNRGLLYLLFEHKDVIEMLLENQNILKARLQGPILVQTTDTDNQGLQSDYSEGNLLLQRIKKKLKHEENILLKNRVIWTPLEKKCKRNMIQIVSTCPLDQMQILQQIEQKDKKKQFKLPSETNKKCCQTKNIIKNYGKSILTFFRRNHSMTKKILQQCSIDQAQFYADFQKYRDRVNSITELKLFWTDRDNKFAKVYRIMSNIYLKKYSLRHTFCSRVRNYSVHIKYRKRLLDVLKNPEDFTSIKYL